MPTSTDQTKAHYAPLFSRFKADLDADSLRVETNCLAYELGQIPDVPEAGLVLDAGCGTGRYALAWRRLHPAATLVGVDVNDAILRTGLVAPDALAPIHGNLEALPFKSGAFDVVMSRGVIQHTADPRRALSELVRVCKPGGILFFYTYRYGAYDAILGVFRKIAKAIGAPLCSRVIYKLSALAGLDTRAPTMILDELFVPIRFAFTERTVLDWLAAEGVSPASIRPVTHAQFGSVDLPVNRRTRWLYRVVPKNGLITLAVRTGEKRGQSP